VAAGPPAKKNSTNYFAMIATARPAPLSLRGYCGTGNSQDVSPQYLAVSCKRNIHKFTGASTSHCRKRILCVKITTAFRGAM
jgi:hypothetical protein